VTFVTDDVLGLVGFCEMAFCIGDVFLTGGFTHVYGTVGPTTKIMQQLSCTSCQLSQVREHLPIQTFLALTSAVTAAKPVYSI
jgi:hypothetical protein